MPTFQNTIDNEQQPTDEHTLTAQQSLQICCL